MPISLRRQRLGTMARLSARLSVLEPFSRRVADVRSGSYGLRLPLNDHRETERKRRALADLQLDPDLAAVHLDDALRYDESQAGAALLLGNRIVGLLELLKQLGLIGSGDPRTGVTDRYIECTIIRPKADIGDFCRMSHLVTGRMCYS